MSENLKSKPVCPHCKTILDDVFDVKSNEMAIPDDITLCINCDELLQFDEDMVLKPVTGDVISEIYLPDIQDTGRIRPKYIEMRKSDC